jgi:hypothetical protein
MSAASDGPAALDGALDEGGEAPCWAHLFDEQRSDLVDGDDVERLDAR